MFQLPDHPLARRGVLLPCLMLVVACAKPGETVFVAPDNSTVTTRLEAAYTGDGQHIVVRNASTVEIVVTSVRLFDCENIKDRCEVTRLRVPVGPGDERRIMTVDVDDRGRASNFRYGFTWEAADAAPPAIPGVPPNP